jgi:hypothetical protein
MPYPARLTSSYLDPEDTGNSIFFGTLVYTKVICMQKMLLEKIVLNLR